MPRATSSAQDDRGTLTPLARQGQDAIVVEHLTHRFVTPAGPVLAVEDVSFRVPEGRFLAMVGPSGCGKTTILNIVAGLIAPSEGRVLVNGESVNRPSRTIGYMTARDGLLPWRSARENVAFGLEIRGVAPAVRREKADALLRLVHLGGFEQAYRSQLSQGMRQRVALARTLAIDPLIFLLDEPFAALDAQTKMILQDEFVRIWERSGQTVMFVTHDITEAVALSDCIVVISRRPGRIKSEIEVDLPRPRNLEEVRFSQHFTDLVRLVWDQIRGEISKDST
jgi:NitT/TauT family transport system ATP-binding protein